MRNVRVEQIKDSVIVIKPVYFENGNFTELWQSNGYISLDKRSIDGVIKALARYDMLDLRAQRTQLRQELQRGTVLPFYLSDRRVFVPVKMRHGIVGKDKCNGYVNVSFIKEIVPSAGGDSGCLVKLINGREVESLSPKRTVVANQHIGLELMKNLHAESTIDEDMEKDIIAGVNALAHIFININHTLNKFRSGNL